MGWGEQEGGPRSGERGKNRIWRPRRANKGKEQGMKNGEEKTRTRKGVWKSQRGEIQGGTELEKQGIEQGLRDEERKIGRKSG